MTKAKPLSTANTPNDLDPAVVDKLAELDRTDPIDPSIVSEEELQEAHAAEWIETFGTATDPGPTGLDFEAAMALEQGGMTGIHMISSSGEEKTYHWSRDGVLNPEDTLEPTANPYILESNTVLNDLRSAANQARRTIDALDREIADIDRTADEQIALINARRDANKSQREKRKEDLMKIVAADAMVNGQPTEGTGQ